MYSRFRQQRHMRLYPHPRTLNPIRHRRFGVQINRQRRVMLLRRLLVRHQGATGGNTVRHLNRRAVLFLQHIQLHLRLYGNYHRFLNANYRCRATITQLDRTGVFRFRLLFPFRQTVPAIDADETAPVAMCGASTPDITQSPSACVFSKSSKS